MQLLVKDRHVLCALKRLAHVTSPQAGTIANISSSIVNLGLILLMGRVYTALAEQLTKWGKTRHCTPPPHPYLSPSAANKQHY